MGNTVWRRKTAVGEREKKMSFFPSPTWLTLDTFFFFWLTVV